MGGAHVGNTERETVQSMRTGVIRGVAREELPLTAPGR